MENIHEWQELGMTYEEWRDIQREFYKLDPWEQRETEEWLKTVEECEIMWEMLDSGKEK